MNIRARALKWLSFWVLKCELLLMGIGVPRNLIVLASGEINKRGVEKDAWGGKCFIGTRDWQKMAFCGELLSNSLGYSWKNEKKQ